MRLNRYGEIVQKWWEEIPRHFSNVETGAFVIMPNHVHGIIFIVERRGTVPVPEEGGVNKILDENDMTSEVMGGETPPYVHQPWGKSLRISNINLQRK